MTPPLQAQQLKLAEESGVAREVEVHRRRFVQPRADVHVRRRITGGASLSMAFGIAYRSSGAHESATQTQTERHSAAQPPYRR